MKKLFFALLLIVLIVIGAFIYNETRGKAVIGDGLSERGKRFLATQKGQDSNLSDIDFSEKSGGIGQKITVEDCFSFTMTFSVRFSRLDSECNVSYGTDVPRGTIVIYKVKGAISSFDEVPGVSLRRKESQKYKESAEVIDGRKFLLFTTTQDEQVLNAFYYESDFYFVANFIGSASDATKAKMIKLLETVEFGK